MKNAITATAETFPNTDMGQQFSAIVATQVEDRKAFMLAGKLENSVSMKPSSKKL